MRRSLRCTRLQVQTGSQQEVEVALRCQHPVPFGCAVRFVGSHDALGAWEAHAAQGALLPGPAAYTQGTSDVRLPAALEWQDGHVWLGKVRLPPGEYEGKCVIVNGDGAAQQWEEGSNRAFAVRSSPVQAYAGES